MNNDNLNEKNVNEAIIEIMMKDFCNFIAITTWINAAEKSDNPEEFKNSSIKLWKKSYIERMNKKLGDYNKAMSELNNSPKQEKESILSFVNETLKDKMADTEDLMATQREHLKFFQDNILSKFLNNEQ